MRGYSITFLRISDGLRVIAGLFFWGTFFVFPASCLAAIPAIPFTVNVSEAVTVDTSGGTPRIAVDVGGVTRYATYTSGSGTNTLTFTYTATAGDIDLDGVTLASPIEANGGTLKDLNGNDANLGFTVPNTSNVKVNYPSLGMDFIYDADGRYTLNGTAYNDLSSFLSATGGTFSRASIGTYYDSTGTLQTASAGSPRFDYDPVTHNAKGILIEESRTNVAPYNAPAGQSATVIASTIAGPNGTISGHKITCNGVNTIHAVAPSGTLATAIGTTYTDSIFVKAGTLTKVQISISSTVVTAANGYANFDLIAGTTTVGAGASTSGMSQLPNGWWRIWVTFTATGTGGGPVAQVTAITAMSDPRIPGNTSTDDFYIYGPQRETGGFLTSYIPTTTAAVTRQTDILTMPTGTWFNASEGSALARISGYKHSVAGVFALNDSAGVNRYDDRAGQQYAFFSDSGGTNTLVGPTAFSATTGGNVAIAYSSSIAKMSFNGGAVTNGSPAANATGINKLWIGNIDTGGYPLDGHVKMFKYYPLVPTDSQLQSLSQ